MNPVYLFYLQSKKNRKETTREVEYALERGLQPEPLVCVLFPTANRPAINQHSTFNSTCILIITPMARRQEEHPACKN